MWLLFLSFARATPGSLDPVVVCSDAPAQRYALYRPPGWTSEGQWPLLLVLDPRGRALEALAVFRPGAEAWGFVVASAYESRSDTVGPDPTPAAVVAILDDVLSASAIAEGAVTLAGFSGTARTAYDIGRVAPDTVVAVIGVGAATSAGAAPEGPLPFAWHGIAGRADFNYLETRRTAEILWTLDSPAAFAAFEGTHGWPDPDTAGRALAWVAWQAHRAGRWPGSDPSPRARRLLEGHLAAAGATPAAWRTAMGIPDGSAAAAALVADRQVSRGLRREARMAEVEVAARGAQEEVARWMLDPTRSPPGLTRARTLLGIGRLEAAVARDRTSDDGQRGARLLSQARARFGTYLPREARRSDHPAGAVASLELAASIPPPSATFLYDLGCARAVTGDLHAAMDALARADAAGPVDRSWAAQDPDLAPLHGLDAFAAWLAGPQP